MFKVIAIGASLLLALPAIASLPPAASQAPAPDGAAASDQVCKYVVSAERGAKPHQLCMTKDQWAAKAASDAQDANRIVCRYEDVPGTKLKGRKVCQPASQWAADKDNYREQVEDMQMSVCVAGAGC